MRLIFLIVLIASASSVRANDFEGLCIFNPEPGCVEERTPILNNTFDFCEQSCTLSNPVNVRNMLDGVLYDVFCFSDTPLYEDNMDERVLVLSRFPGGDIETVEVIGNTTHLTLVLCSP